jgi:DNA-directed RNA polymerase sigma subunit (sigma70/sigma32)
MKNNFNTPPSDIELVGKIQDGHKTFDEALKQLINRHSGIYVKMVNSYLRNNSEITTSQAKKEILQDKDYRIYLAALKYDPEKGAKFSTHLGNETKWMCLNLFNKTKNRGKLEKQYKDAVRAELFEDNLLSEDIENDNLLAEIYRLAENHADNRVRKIFKLRYKIGEGNKVMAWDRISSQINLSIQGCINIHNKAIEQIKQKLKEKNA